MKKLTIGFKRALMVAGLSAFSSVASAALLATLPGNDCAGVFGDSFAECAIPDEWDLDNSPIIIKFNYSDGVPGAIEINSALFPSIDGSEFAFTGTGGSFGTWTYTPGPDDPAINFYTAKGGPDFNLFSNDGDPLAGDWFTPGGTTGPALSHIGFYDTERGEIPEPGSLALLGVGLLGIAGLARRRRSAA